MPKYTRGHYQDIGDTIRGITDPKKKKEQFDIWDTKFASDNPRYNRKKLKAWVNAEDDW